MLWICGAAMGFAPEWDSAAVGLYAGAPGGAGVGLRHLRVLVMGAQVPKGLQGWDPTTPLGSLCQHLMAVIHLYPT